MFAPDLEKLAYNLIGVTAPVLFFLWKSKRKEKREQEVRHAELLTEHRFLPPHRHGEKDGPLYADGINFAPKPDGHL